MRQRQCLHQILIQAQLCGNGARNLGHFNGMSQPVAKMVRVAVGEDLRLIFKPAKRARMDHAVTVTLEVCAIGMAWLGIATASAFFLLESVRSLHFRLLIILCRSAPRSSLVAPLQTA